METSTLITTIISSSVVASVLSALITFIINRHFKKLDFKNEYFKLVIGKRLEAYDKLEYLIAALKTSALDALDQKAYHVCFFNHENFQDFSERLALANAYNLWINPTTSEKLSELNTLFNQTRFEFELEDELELIAAGKKYYSQIATFRTQLENLARADLLGLYDFKAIKNRSTPDELQQINIPKSRIERLKGKR